MKPVLKVLLFKNTPAAAPANDLLTSLVSHWSLDEASGTRADSHGSNTLADNNTVGSATGKISNGADFVNTNSERLSIASNTTLETGDIDFTISCWFKSDGSTGASQTIVNKDRIGVGREYSLILDASGQLSFILFTGAEAVYAIPTGTALSYATWYHALAWHDSATNTAYIRINDSSEYSDVGSGSYVAETGAIFGIGGENSGTRFFNGTIDEVSFWKRLLTSDEKTDLYNSGAARAYSYYESDS